MKDNSFYTFNLVITLLLVMFFLVAQKGICSTLLPNEEIERKPVAKEADQSTPAIVVRDEVQAAKDKTDKDITTVSEKANVTGAGLYSAGYSASEAVDILNNTYNDSEVRISCVKAGYNAADVDNALKSAHAEVKNPDQAHNVMPAVAKPSVAGPAEISGTKNPDQAHNVVPIVSKPEAVIQAAEISGANASEIAAVSEPVTAVDRYKAIIADVSYITDKINNGESVSDDELSVAVNQLASFLKSDQCNELTAAQQNHLINKFANFSSDLLFNPDNNMMGDENVLNTVVSVYSARLDAAQNNEVLASVIVHLGGNIGKLWASNNKNAGTSIENALGKWIEKNDAKIKSLVADINNYVSNPTEEGAKSVGLKASAVLRLVYHHKSKLKSADGIMKACADLMKSEGFNDVTYHKASVFWLAQGVINKYVVADAASAGKIADVVTGKSGANGNASLELVEAFFGAVKAVLMRGGIEGEENTRAFNAFHAGIQSMSLVLTRISNKTKSSSAVERISEHMFSGIPAENLQSYLNVAQSKIKEGKIRAGTKVSYCNGMINLLTYGAIGNADIDVSVGSANFNKVMTTVRGLIGDKSVMLKVRDLRTVNNFVLAIEQLSKLVLLDPSLTMSQKEEYAETFGSLLNSALTFHKDSNSVNPASYALVKTNAKTVFDRLVNDFNAQGYNDLSQRMQEKLKGAF